MSIVFKNVSLGVLTKESGVTVVKKCLFHIHMWCDKDGQKF